MSRVILYRTVATRHKFLDPSRDLCEYIPKHDSILFMTSFHGPPLFLTLALFIIYSCKQIIQLGRGAEVDASLVLIT